MVELMVGVAIGLFVVAGATLAVSNQLGDNRRLMLETQIQQDLRAAADVIARDLRRAGYWANAQAGVWHAGAVSVDLNPRVALSPASGVASEVGFEYSRGNPLNEDAGFRLVDNTIQMRVGGQWQALTDSTTLRVTEFRVTVNRQVVALSCLNECAGGGSACWPTQSVREIEVFIDGTAVHDPSVRRNARSNVRLRNDVINGACPA
jgi:type IV pilus assembly protein PilW